MIRNTSLSIIVTLTFIATSLQGICQIDLADRAIRKMMDDLEIPGMSIAVSKKGQTIYSKSFGYADLKKGVKVEEETLFRMASVSKLFAAGAIAKLLDEGKVNLDDPVEKYLQNYPHSGKGVTIRRILNHTSGIRHYGRGDAMINVKNYPTTQKALEIFINDDLESEPGTKFRYSTHAFTLLAAIVEKVTGLTYTNYLEREFFQPLGMNRSRPDVKGEMDEKQSILYNGMKKLRLIDNASYKRAGGGMLSTAKDLLRFGEIHLSEGFYKQRTVDSLFRPSVEMPGTLNKTEVAMAWRISTDDKGEVVYHHAGNMSGARTLLLLSPSNEMVVAIMTNNRELDFIEHFGLAVRDLFLVESEKIEPLPEVMKVGENCTVTVQGNGLYYTAEIDIPEVFEQALKINLIASYSENGLLLKNLQISEDVLYLEIERGKLLIYVKDDKGKWTKKEYAEG